MEKQQDSDPVKKERRSRSDPKKGGGFTKMSNILLSGMKEAFKWKKELHNGRNTILHVKVVHSLFSQ